ncbi:MAG TPA: hypothetical protein VKT29_06220 [Terriglobales bacterium]|nr:hypothetical protein [Terriglobales bacterium]
MTKLVAIVLAAFCLCGSLAAQENSSKIAKYVYYEDAKVNSGKFRIFAKTVGEFRDAAATSAPDSYWIVGSPMTGDTSTFSFVTFQDSMAGVEKFASSMDKAGQAVMAKDANFEQESAESDGGSRLNIAKYNEELSFRPEAVSLADTQYWMSEVFELRPGCGHDFDVAVKTVMALHKKAGDNQHWLTYNIMSGPSLPAVLFVVPMKSLAEQDEEPTAASKELFQSPPVQAMLSSMSKECVMHVSTAYFRVEPSLSRPMPALVTANPSFWTVKEETVSAAPMKKGKKRKM